MPKVQLNRKTGAYHINIPKSIAQAVGMRPGQDYNVQISRNGNLELVRILEAPYKDGGQERPTDSTEEKPTVMPPGPEQQLVAGPGQAHGAAP